VSCLSHHAARAKSNACPKTLTGQKRSRSEGIQDKIYCASRGIYRPAGVVCAITRPKLTFRVRLKMNTFIVEVIQKEK